MGKLAIAACLLLAASALEAQSIADRVREVDDGKVRMSFAARPGVCGMGTSINISRDTDDWEYDCEPGPVRVVLNLRDGRVVRVKTYVGGRFRPSTSTTTEILDLGTVSASEAASYLVALAGRGTGDEEHGRGAIFAASLADSADIWRDVLRIARDDDVPHRTRKRAVEVLSWEVSRIVRAGVEDEEDDDTRSIQSSAVFAISQRPKSESVPILMRIAREHSDPVIRGKALFWLGQSGDPRAVDVFEEILTQGG